jgi:hypothetical protein
VGPLRADRDLADLVAPRVEVLHLLEAGLLDEAALVGAVIGHQGVRRGVEALDETAALLVDVEAIRAADPLHAALFDPRFGPREELAREVGVVDGVEEAEEAGVVLVAREVLAIDLGGDAPDGLAAPVRDPAGALGVLEERVLLRVEAIRDVEVEGADVVGSPA